MSLYPMFMGKVRCGGGVVFRSYNPGQGQLPMHLDDLVPEDDLARVIHEVVERLDISGIVNAIKNRRKKSLYRGEPAYHPQLLLKLLFYGYCTGTFSSRKIAAQTRTLLPMMWLAGTEHPNFRTISDFRKTHFDEIAKLFVQVLGLAKALGMVKMGHVAIDGSKLKANASKNKNASKEKLEAAIPKLQEEIKRLLQRAEETDRLEDQEYGEQEETLLPAELRQKQARLARLEQELAKLKAQQEGGQRSTRTDTEKQSINATDPDSRIMARRHRSSIQGYNGQIAVDGDSGVIVGATVANNPIDAPQFVPVLDDIQQSTGNQPDKVSGDTGYFSGDNLAVLEARGIDGYLADDTTKIKRANNPFSKDHFVYDEVADAYRCPQGQSLPFKGQYEMSDGRIQRRYWNRDACKACPVRDQCTKYTHRMIARDTLEPQRTAMRAKLQTPEGKKEYNRRKAIVEPAWGHIKEVLGFDTVSVRSLKAVQAEFRLVCSAYNIRKIAARLRRTSELWLTMRAWRGERKVAVQPT